MPSRKLTTEEAKEYLIRSNRNNGSWDYDLLKNFSGVLKPLGLDENNDIIYQYDKTKTKENLN